MSFTSIIITANKDTGFSFGLISDKDTTKRGDRVKYGIPEYLTVTGNEEECVSGRLDHPDEEFLVSITGDKQNSLMSNLEVSLKLNEGKELVQLSKEIAKSEMLITIDKEPKTPLPSEYEFCFTSKETVFFTFIQSSRLVYLPEETTVFVKGVTNFTFYSEGKSLLEINECKSRAVATVYKSFDTTSRLNSPVRQVRRTNNIMEFTHYGPVYLQVQAKSGTIAWRRKDELKKLGYGYDQYFATKLRY